MEIYDITKIYLIVDLFVIMSIILGLIKIKNIGERNPEFLMKMAKNNNGDNKIDLKLILLIILPLLHFAILFFYIIICLIPDEKVIELFEKSFEKEENIEELIQERDIKKEHLKQLKKENEKLEKYFEDQQSIDKNEKK